MIIIFFFLMKKQKFEINSPQENECVFLIIFLTEDTESISFSEKLLIIESKVSEPLDAVPKEQITKSRSQIAVHKEQLAKSRIQRAVHKEQLTKSRSQRAVHK